MQTNHVNRETLRRLAALRTGEAPIVSLYLNLDPAVVPTPRARETQLDSLIGEAERAYLKPHAGSHEERLQLQGDLERVRRYVVEEFSAKAAHGLAVFCAGGAGIFEALTLPRPVRPTVVVDRAPFLAPLAEMALGDGWGVVLTTRRTARVLRGSLELLGEVGRVADDVHKWHAQGGWSQARFQRGVRKEAQEHIRRTVELLGELHREQPFRHLVLGVAEELNGELEAALPPDLRRLVRGRIDVDVERASPEEVRRVAAAVIERTEERHEQEVLTRLADDVHTGGRAAAGLDEVLEALNARRVEALLLEQGPSRPGVACPACGRLAVAGEVCPLDGTPLQTRADVIDDAVALAQVQDAVVEVVRFHADALAERGSIGALLRY